jgi:hypothetical protein
MQLRAPRNPPVYLVKIYDFFTYSGRNILIVYSIAELFTCRYIGDPDVIHRLHGKQ